MLPLIEVSLEELVSSITENSIRHGRNLWLISNKKAYTLVNSDSPNWKVQFVFNINTHRVTIELRIRDILMNPGYYIWAEHTVLSARTIWKDLVVDGFVYPSQQ
jgi:hypothetical protein